MRTPDNFLTEEANVSSLDQKFADMPVGVARRWQDWARDHDWGQKARLRDGRMTGCVSYHYAYREDGTEYLAEARETFATPRAMRNWAGY